MQNNDIARKRIKPSRPYGVEFIIDGIELINKIMSLPCSICLWSEFCPYIANE